jgi:hypothetical protein
VQLPETVTPSETATEVVADSAVEIAQIEADKEVTLAAIDAETQTARIDANERESERWHDQELASLREQNSTLREKITELETLVASLIPPRLSEEVTPEPEPETMTVSSATVTETSNETKTEAPAEREEEKAVETALAAIVPGRVKIIMI